MTILLMTIIPRYIDLLITFNIVELLHNLLSRLKSASLLPEFFLRWKPYKWRGESNLPQWSDDTNIFWKPMFVFFKLKPSFFPDCRKPRCFFKLISSFSYYSYYKIKFLFIYNYYLFSGYLHKSPVEWGSVGQHGSCFLLNCYCLLLHTLLCLNAASLMTSFFARPTPLLSQH